MLYAIVCPDSFLAKYRARTIAIQKKLSFFFVRDDLELKERLRPTLFEKQGGFLVFIPWFLTESFSSENIRELCERSGFFCTHFLKQPSFLSKQTDIETEIINEKERSLFKLIFNELAPRWDQEIFDYLYKNSKDAGTFYFVLKNLSLYFEKPPSLNEVKAHVSYTEQEKIFPLIDAFLEGEKEGLVRHLSSVYKEQEFLQIVGALSFRLRELIAIARRESSFVQRWRVQKAHRIIQKLSIKKALLLLDELLEIETGLKKDPVLYREKLFSLLLSFSPR